MKRGKRGGFRIIYYFFSQYNKIYLLTIYSKAQKETIKKSELKKYLFEIGLEL